MMLVKMLKTAVGSNDGLTAKKYIINNIYDLSPELSKCFLDMGACVEASKNAKPTGKGKAVNEAHIAQKQMQALVDKDAAAQLNNKKEGVEDEST